MGVEFEIPDGGETIPPSGFAVVTAFFLGPALTRCRVSARVTRRVARRSP